jgi:hypothetical protein
MATDKTKFDKLVGKYTASTVPFRPKTACVCSTNNQPGFLRLVSTGGGDSVTCAVPNFDASGGLVGSSSCTLYVVLGK